jgi:hypothetical protein
MTAGKVTTTSRQRRASPRFRSTTIFEPRERKVHETTTRYCMTDNAPPNQHQTKDRPASGPREDRRQDDGASLARETAPVPVSRFSNGARRVFTTDVLPNVEPALELGAGPLHVPAGLVGAIVRHQGTKHSEEEGEEGGARRAVRVITGGGGHEGSRGAQHSTDRGEEDCIYMNVYGSLQSPRRPWCAIRASYWS